MPLFLAILILGVGTSCSSAKKAEEEDALEPPVPVETSQLGDSDRGRAFGMVSIPFDYRESELSPAKKALIKKNVEILKLHPGTMVEIEGHCDWRGGHQLNMELGEKRARAVRAFMVASGIDPLKLTSISYGNTRPLQKGTDEGAMAKNRRVNFLIISR